MKEFLAGVVFELGWDEIVGGFSMRGSFEIRLNGVDSDAFWTRCLKVSLESKFLLQFRLQKFQYAWCCT